MNIVILIPTYNESENIGLLLKELLVRIKKLSKYKFKILVVDDNSPDGTGKIVNSFRKRHSNIYLLQGEKKGLGSAMTRGYKYALNKLHPDVVITNEADFAFSFKHLPLMLKKIEEGYDVVVASRHVGVGKTEGWTLTRRLNHWVANTFFGRWIAGVTVVYDKNGAYRAVRATSLRKIRWDRLHVHGFAFFFYLIYKLSQVTNNFYEFPATYTFRKRGESKVSFNTKYIKSYLKDILEYTKLAVNIRFGNTIIR